MIFKIEISVIHFLINLKLKVVLKRVKLLASSILFFPIQELLFHCVISVTAVSEN